MPVEKAEVVMLQPRPIARNPFAAEALNVIASGIPFAPRREDSLPPSLLQYALARMQPSIAARVTAEWQVECYRMQYEREYPVEKISKTA
jgi:hypothetical protein